MFSSCFVPPRDPIASSTVSLVRTPSFSRPPLLGSRPSTSSAAFYRLPFRSGTDTLGVGLPGCCCRHDVDCQSAPVLVGDCVVLGAACVVAWPCTAPQRRLSIVPESPVVPAALVPYWAGARSGDCAGAHRVRPPGAGFACCSCRARRTSCFPHMTPISFTYPLEHPRGCGGAATSVRGHASGRLWTPRAARRIAGSAEVVGECRGRRAQAVGPTGSWKRALAVCSGAALQPGTAQIVPGRRRGVWVRDGGATARVRRGIDQSLPLSSRWATWCLLRGSLPLARSSPG